MANEDTSKVKLYTRLCYQYFFNLPDTAIFYGEKALLLSQKIKFKRGEASAYFTLWVPFFTKGEYARALDYIYKQLHVQEELGDDKNVGDTHIGFSNIYREQGDLQRALKHILIAKSIYEKLKMNDCRAR